MFLTEIFNDQYLMRVPKGEKYKSSIELCVFVVFVAEFVDIVSFFRSHVVDEEIKWRHNMENFLKLYLESQHYYAICTKLFFLQEKRYVI